MRPIIAGVTSGGVVHLWEKLADPVWEATQTSDFVFLEHNVYHAESEDEFDEVSGFLASILHAS